MKKLQAQLKAEKKPKDADFKMSQKINEEACRSLEVFYICLHWSPLKKWTVVPLFPFLSSFMLGHNFYMLLYYQATDSPTMSYIVHRTKPQTFHESKFCNIQTKF